MNHTPTQEQSDYYAVGTDPHAGSIALRARAGSGKCLGLGTPVLLASGAIKPVQEIKAGDYLAGPNEPRLVLSASTGYGELVQITPTKGDSWVCNMEHILTLAGSNRAIGRTIDMSVKEYLSRLRIPGFNRTWKLFRAPISYWPEAELPIDPYIFGLWVGDGHSGEPMFTNQDQVVLSAIERWAISQGYTYTEWPTHSSFPGEKYQEHCKTVRVGSSGEAHPMRQYLRSFTGKQIPSIYRTSSAAQRLELLAGIIDSDGSLDSNSFTGYEVTFRDYWLAEDLCFIARSLGFAAYTKLKRVAGYPYYRTYISGETNKVPVRIEYKQARPRSQVKRVSVTGFSITPIGPGNYYGFTLNGDGRFLLGDFTVTHNTHAQRELASRLPGSGLATSVLKSTVRDLAAVMPQNWEVKGLHALGYAGIRKKFPRARLDNNGNALYEFVKETLHAEDDWWKSLPDIRALVEQAMLAGIVPEHERWATPDTEEEWTLLADRFDIDMTPQVYEIARAAVIHLNKLALQGTITFIHMLTLPLFFGFPVSQYPKIIVDEAQDLNPLQKLMVRKALRYNGRVFVTGDDRQAVMAFSGAMSDSFNQLVDEFSCTVLPLTISWRCPRAVIEVAQRYVPDIQAAPNAIEGAVIEATAIDVADLPRTILCRNNGPLTRLAMKLFVSGYSVECAGKDIGAGLKSTINRIATSKTSDQMRSAEFLSRLERWAAREIERRPARKHSVLDKRDALTALAEHHKTVGDIRRHIDRLYVPDDKQGKSAEFQLFTIHKAKGREWDRVGFLDAHLLPSKFAKQTWELEQENNLLYVAVTRAKQELVYLNSALIQ